MIRIAFENAVKLIPYYWPMTTFISRNPLMGFEDMPFREGLKKASKLFKAKVYMPSSYYVELYKDGIIKKDVFEENLLEELRKIGLENYFQEAKTFMVDISPSLDEYKKVPKDLDEAILKHVKTKDNISTTYYQKGVLGLIEELCEDMILCEIVDAVFDKNYTDIIEKEIVEFIARFLDEGQTTMSMPERERGMFEAFKLYEGIKETLNEESFVEKHINFLNPSDIERYILNHFVKDFGWSSFIKYRSEAQDYYFQIKYPSSMMAYLAIRLYFEHKYLKKAPIKNFDAFRDFASKNPYYVVLKLLKAKNMLYPKFLDEIELGKDYKAIFEEYLNYREVQRASLLQNVIYAMSLYLDNPKALIELVEFLEEEEGYIWLVSLEDSYIKDLSKEFLMAKERELKSNLATAIFCIDVRSEAIRRNLERFGHYNTYGVAGFFGTPIAFIEFDKGHEIYSCPVIMKPEKIVLELPKESHKEYEQKKNINYTFKKILESLKNNPYTPFFMVEAMGWLFGINLFGKTLFPGLTQKLMKNVKAQKPDTTFTIDKLSEQEIEEYAKRFFVEKIQEAYHEAYKKNLKYKDALEILNTILNEKAYFDAKFLELLKTKYNVTKEAYEFQKQKLSMIGYTPEEQVSLVYNFLKLIGFTKDFPKFVFLFGHGSTSDNNPFESALDCGACGGNNGLANVRVLARIANKKYVKEALALKGIFIPEDTVFIPGIHDTTTDELELYDLDFVPETHRAYLNKVLEDFKLASQKTREERAKMLPYADNPEKIFIRAIDWSETRPEWGLSKNMGAYVGKRSSTQNLALKNRVFMQSYDWEIDKDGSILKNILAGPYLIGEWINLEYYFSTTDNEKLGAGSKVYHNVVGKVGVWTGNYGDLRTGLPYQTVYVDGKPYHEPMRLLVFVEAPIEKVMEAAKSVPKALELVLNEWTRVIIIDKTKGSAFTIKNKEVITVFEQGSQTTA
ncbi:MAG: DUF2309 domain-containing protein [Hydrogenobaculum sp.]